MNLGTYFSQRIDGIQVTCNNVFSVRDSQFPIAFQPPGGRIGAQSLTSLLYFKGATLG